MLSILAAIECFIPVGYTVLVGVCVCCRDHQEPSRTLPYASISAGVVKQAQSLIKHPAS